jgi:transcriptional regulator with XRE-family HTH domain
MKTKTSENHVEEIERENDISWQLWHAVNDSGLSAYRLADLSGVSHTVINRWLRGERDITLQTAAKLAACLDLELKPARPKRRPR